MKQETFTASQFLVALVENAFNATKAYKSLKPRVTLKSAKTMGSRYLQKLRASDVFQEYVFKAMKNINDSLDSGNERLKFEASKYVLDKGLPKSMADEINPLDEISLDIPSKELSNEELSARQRMLGKMIKEQEEKIKLEKESS